MSGPHAQGDPERQTALLLVDLIHPFDFDGAEQLWRRAARLIEPVGALLERARARSVPVIYVNDHFGQWRASFHQLVDRAARGLGRPLVEACRPAESDIFVLKPHRSGFYCTPLDLLLADLEVRSLVIVGIATDLCVLSTVNDARIRDLAISVPSDGCEAQTEGRHRRALELMRDSFDVELVRCDELLRT